MPNYWSKKKKKKRVYPHVTLEYAKLLVECKLWLLLKSGACCAAAHTRTHVGLVKGMATCLHLFESQTDWMCVHVRAWASVRVVRLIGGMSFHGFMLMSPSVLLSSATLNDSLADKNTWTIENMDWSHNAWIIPENALRLSTKYKPVFTRFDGAD